MLRHPTLDQLHALGLHGMAKAFAELADADGPKDLVHADWLALLLDNEISWRRDKRLAARLSCAIRQASKTSTTARREVLIGRCSKGSPRETGSTPTTIWSWSARPESERVGWLAPSATKLAATIAPSSIIAGRNSAATWRSPEGDGRHSRLIRTLGRADLLILDDFGLEPLDASARHDLLEILEERYGRRS